MTTTRGDSPKAETMIAIRDEVERARGKFPGNKHLALALVEEVGELAQAILQDKPVEEIRKEAKQVACVAIRIMEEDDAAFDVKDWSTKP